MNLSVSVDKIIERVRNEPRPSLIWRGIKESSLGFVFGPSKSGKSILTENLGLMIAAGSDQFLGDPININNRRVLYVSMEEFYQHRTQRNILQVQEINSKYGAEWQQNYHVVDDQFPRYLIDLEAWKKLIESIGAFKPGVLIIDSLSRMYQGSIEDSSLAMKVMKPLRNLADASGTAIILIHHTPKLLGKPITIDSLAGSRILAQEADFLIGVHKTQAGQRYLKEVAFRYAQEDDEYVFPFAIDENMIICPSEKASENELLYGGYKNDNTDSIYRFFEEKTPMNGGGIESKDLIKNFVDSGIMSKPSLYSNLKKLCVQGKITKIQHGNYNLNILGSRSFINSKSN